MRGEPYPSGTCLNLNAEDTLVGRMSQGSVPDLAFSNVFISRQHFRIRRELDKAVIYDLGSRHGTEINGERLVPHHPYVLNNSDIIKLANGMTVLHFAYMFAEQTIDIEPASIMKRLEATELPTTIHWDRRECIVRGKRILMSEKEYLLLRMLCENANKLVQLQYIKSGVWPERSPSANGIPDVSLDEVNALIYRIRQKYGKDTFVISAVRGSGYVLETDAVLAKAGDSI